MADTKEESQVKDTASQTDLSTLFPDPQEKKDDASKKTDVEDTSSSEDSEETDTGDLKSQLTALTKELNRVRKSKTESSAEVQGLREQLANVQGQLEAMARSQKDSDTGEGRLDKYSDEQLIQGQTEWEEEIYNAKEAMRQARTDGNDAAYAKANRDLATARATITAIRKTLLERSKRVGAEQAQAQTEANELVQEVAGLYNQAYESFPDLKDRESALWQAGNEAYHKHPKLMKQLGPLGELVAVVLALTEDPTLVSKNEGTAKKEARKELLTEINERVEKSIIKGGATTTKKTVPDFASMPKQDFDAMIHKIKLGG